VTTLMRLSAWLWQIAIRLQPGDVRSKYGEDMRATFLRVVAEAADGNPFALLLAAVRETADVGVTGLNERRRRRAARRRERRTAVFGLRQDLRYAYRMLRRQPAFACVAILTLALGIGADTAVFTVVNAVLLRALPYRSPDRLVLMLWTHMDRTSPFLSPPNYYDLSSQTGVFDGSTVFTPTTMNLTGHGDPERVEGASVSWNFFDVLGITLPHGRGLVADDARASDATTIVLADGLWKRQFGGRADVVGETVRFDGKPFVVVGIAPPDVKLPTNAEFWIPLVFSPSDVSPNARGAQWVSSISRLKPGISVSQADAALAAVSARLAAAYPKTNEGSRALVVPLQEDMVKNVRPALIVLLGAVSLVLLIACVNVANLLLARAQVRMREVAVRAALGAGRRRLLQQFLVESLLLGALGGAGGLVVAAWSTRALVALAPTSIPRLSEIGMDGQVLGFTIVIAVATSLVFGLAPALSASGGIVARMIGSAGRGSVGGRARTRKTLVVCEMALASVLLVGAGLLIRSYEQLRRVDPGFDPEHVVTFNVSLPEAKYPKPSDDGAFVTRLVDQLTTRPGVDGAAAILGLPFAGKFSISTSFTRQGESDNADTPSAGMRIITPDYFKTMRIPLVGGRLFDRHDDEHGAEVVIVNQRAARLFWPGSKPLGQQVHLGVRLVSGVRSGQKTIVGIVGDVKYGSLDREAPPEIYLPYAQHQVDTVTIAVRTAAGDPMTMAPVIRSEVASLDRELPAADIQTMNAIIGSSVAERRFTMLLLATFALVAVALAAVGIYGVLAYIASQRTQEIGVRLAVGATPADVIRLFVGEGARLTLVGLGIGLVGAMLAARVLTSLLFGVTANDPLTFGTVAAGLAVVALAASYLPARRASHLDPSMALRNE